MAIGIFTHACAEAFFGTPLTLASQALTAQAFMPRDTEGSGRTRGGCVAHNKDSEVK